MNNNPPRHTTRTLKPLCLSSIVLFQSIVLAVTLYTSAPNPFFQKKSQKAIQMDVSYDGSLGAVYVGVVVASW
jgi:hypothetical protein